MWNVSRKKKTKECKACGKKTHWISQNRICEKCVAAKILNANTQIKLRKGPIYEKYREKMLMRLQEKE